MYGPAADRNRDRKERGSRGYVSGLFDRLAGRGLDGSTRAPLASLADRLLGNHLGHQAQSASINPFHALLSRELIEIGYTAAIS
jgi:hypothetical protein